MRAGEVCRILKISPPTLKKLRETGVIRVNEAGTSYFDYNEFDVMATLKATDASMYVYVRKDTDIKDDVPSFGEAAKVFIEWDDSYTALQAVVFDICRHKVISLHIKRREDLGVHYSFVKTVCESTGTLFVEEV